MEIVARLGVIACALVLVACGGTTIVEQVVEADSGPLGSAAPDAGEDASSPAADTGAPGADTGLDTGATLQDAGGDDGSADAGPPYDSGFAGWDGSPSTAGWHCITLAPVYANDGGIIGTCLPQGVNYADVPLCGRPSYTAVGSCSYNDGGTLKPTSCTVGDAGSITPADFCPNGGTMMTQCSVWAPDPNPKNMGTITRPCMLDSDCLEKVPGTAHCVDVTCPGQFDTGTYYCLP